MGSLDLQKIIQCGEKSAKIFLNALNTTNGIVSAKVFGSRAKGCAKEGSDIDLCLFVDKTFTIKDKFSLIQRFDESSLPYKVDVLVYNDIQNESLREHIDLVGITIY